jgi:hypothetical protein
LDASLQEINVFLFSHKITSFSLLSLVFRLVQQYAMLVPTCIA